MSYCPLPDPNKHRYTPYIVGALLLLLIFAILGARPAHSETVNEKVMPAPTSAVTAAKAQVATAQPTDPTLMKRDKQAAIEACTAKVQPLILALDNSPKKWSLEDLFKTEEDITGCIAIDESDSLNLILISSSITFEIARRERNFIERHSMYDLMLREDHITR